VFINVASGRGHKHAVKAESVFSSAGLYPSIRPVARFFSVLLQFCLPFPRSLLWIEIFTLSLFTGMKLNSLTRAVHHILVECHI
jgi:hypothetical protein